MAITRRVQFREMLRFAEQKHFLQDYVYANNIYKQASQLYPKNPVPYIRMAQIALAQGNAQTAYDCLATIGHKANATADAYFVKGLSLRKLGRRAESEEAFDQCLLLKPDYIEIHQMRSTDSMPGPGYRVALQKFHELLKPRVYLEIGIERGATLSLAKDSYMSIGVDPMPLVPRGHPDNFRIFKMTSDRFFASQEAKDLFRANPADMVFIDGLHEFSQVLRDFINAEAVSSVDGVIILHDVIPLNEATATKERNTMFWSGDTWKVVPALKELCPDLRIRVVPVAPTGLAIVNKLSPKRRLAERKVLATIRAYDAIDFAESRRIKDVGEIKLDSLESEITAG